MSEKKEKEIVLDLSKKIKISDTRYISLGSFILSFIIMAIQFVICLSVNDWVITEACLVLLLNFVYAIRGENTKDKKEEPTEEESEKDD